MTSLHDVDSEKAIEFVGYVSHEWCIEQVDGCVIEISPEFGQVFLEGLRGSALERRIVEELHSVPVRDERETVLISIIPLRDVVREIAILNCLTVDVEEQLSVWLNDGVIDFGVHFQVRK
ncbi:hypothetical protein F7U66_01520 [Vibrio parahaemolyticus]|nr:hypothetical protein [Vibrio parahaemolyticus]